MKYIFETYLNIISEEQNPFDKDKYIFKFIYNDIHVYFSRYHLIQRSIERYATSLNLIYAVKRFLKEFKSKNSKMTKTKMGFSVKFLKSNLMFAGEFHIIAKKLYCKINTVLPPNGFHKKNDLYLEIDA